MTPILRSLNSPLNCCWARSDPSLVSLISHLHCCGHRGVQAELEQQLKPQQSLGITSAGTLASAGQPHTVGTPLTSPCPSIEKPQGVALGGWVLRAESAGRCRSRACPSPQAHTDVAFPLTCLPKISTPTLFLNLRHFSPPPPIQAKAVPPSHLSLQQRAPRKANPAAQGHRWAPHLWGEGSGVHPHAREHQQLCGGMIGGNLPSAQLESLSG